MEHPEKRPPRPRPPTAAQVRRRRTALALVAGAAAILGVVVGAGGGSDDSEPSTAAGPVCPERIAADSARLVGQRLMVRIDDEPTPELLERARRGELGGVIVFPSEGVDPKLIEKGIEELGEAALVGGFEPPLVATDQEGGDVKRFPDLPPTVSPARMDAGEGPTSAREQGLRTAEALRRVGIDVDLAPVLDLGTDTSFVASRTFSDDPDTVAELGTEFAAGLAEGGVAAAVKHFPGLGAASADSDAGESTVDAARGELGPGLAPFEAAIGADVPLVMTANATYTALDDAPATLSRAVTTKLLRDELGFGGVVITDDLGAGSIVAAGLDESEAAVAAAEAGADLLLFALSDGSDAAKALERALRRGDLGEAQFVASCERVTALRERLAG